MNRTKKLMTAVTSSLLLRGAMPGPVSLSAPYSQTAPKQLEHWKTDPAVQKAAEQIFAWMEGTSKAEAKTKDQILRKFPQFSPVMVDKALKRLSQYEGRIKQLGDGSRANPYRYYEHGIQNYG